MQALHRELTSTDDDRSASGAHVGLRLGSRAALTLASEFKDRPGASWHRQTLTAIGGRPTVIETHLAPSGDSAGFTGAHPAGESARWTLTRPHLHTLTGAEAPPRTACRTPACRCRATAWACRCLWLCHVWCQSSWSEHAKLDSLDASRASHSHNRPQARNPLELSDPLETLAVTRGRSGVRVPHRPPPQVLACWRPQLRTSPGVGGGRIWLLLCHRGEAFERAAERART